MTAPTRISELLSRMGVDPDVPRQKPVPFEQTDEYRKIVEGQRQARLRRAGLLGAYAEADSPLGRECFERAKRGRGTYLHGGCGTGKTYAAACAVRLALREGMTARLVTTTALLAEIRGEWGTPSEGEAKRRAERIGLLALDDFGVENPSESTKQELTDVVDARCVRGLPMIFTSNYRLGEFVGRWGKVPGERVVSRIGGACEIVRVDGADRRLS